MSFEINDRIGYKLTWPMKRRLSTSHRLDELGSAVIAEVVDLLLAQCADLASAAGIHGMELCGDDGRIWWWEGGRVAGVGLGGKQALNKTVLKNRGVQ
jgi:hypothetical protein